MPTPINTHRPLRCTGPRRLLAAAAETEPTALIQRTSARRYVLHYSYVSLRYPTPSSHKETKSNHSISPPLLSKSTDERSSTAVPEGFHILKPGFPQPSYLILQRRSHAIEIQETTAGFYQRKSLAVDR